MQEESTNAWELWKNKHYIPISRAISGFGDVDISPKGIRIQLSKNTPVLRRKTIENMAARAGSCVSTSLPALTRDIIFVRRG